MRTQYCSSCQAKSFVIIYLTQGSFCETILGVKEKRANQDFVRGLQVGLVSSSALILSSASFGNNCSANSLSLSL